MDQKPTSKTRSAHVIDLRQSKTTDEAPKPTAKKPSAPRKPQAPAKPSPQPPAPEEQPAQPQTAQRRFWPSFFRFLLLLIILGLIIAGGVYIYITYYM